jgi:hypothetical protein
MSRMLWAVFAVVFVLAIAGSAFAGTNDKWIIYLKAADSGGANYLASACQLGTNTTVMSVSNATTPSPATKAVLGLFDLGSGTYGNGYYKDLRTSMESGTGTWRLRLWVESSWTSGDIYLTGYNPGSPSLWTFNGTLPPMKLKVANDPTGTYGSGTVLNTFDGSVHGTLADPEFTVVFHNSGAVKNSNGSSYIDLVLTNVPEAASLPEPSTVMTLLGLLGGSGLALVRRRRS